MRLVAMTLIGLIMVVPSWAESPQDVESAGRFRLWHDVEDILTWTWGGPDGFRPPYADLSPASSGCRWWRQLRR
jgi:hypothetical protein